MTDRPGKRQDPEMENGLWTWRYGPSSVSGQDKGCHRRAVFLDRDGVINAMWYDREHGLVDSPGNPEQLELLPGAARGIRLLNEMGLLTVVVSNQPGIAKGRFTVPLLEAMTAKMVEDLQASHARLDEVLCCLHHPQALEPAYRKECACRKPKPGLLFSAAEELGIDLSRSYMVGDGLTDIQAGHAAGCRTIWVGNLKLEIARVMEQEGVRPDDLAENLLEAVYIIRKMEGYHGNFS